MRLELAYITQRRQGLKSGPAQALTEEYLKRTSRYAPMQATAYDSETALLAAVEKAGGRAPASMILLDSRGQALSSEAFAARLRQFRDTGTQMLFLAIGPADGWSPIAWARANLRFSLGAITLPHELAIAVLAEQIYRAQTILASHPYHGGHA